MLPKLATNEPVIDAPRKFAVAGLSALPVFDEACELAGVLFDRDIARWVAMRDANSATANRPRYV